MPSSFASSAWNVRPLNNRSSAAPHPTTRGKIHEMPYSAMSPRRANAVVNLAPAAAKRMSFTDQLRHVGVFADGGPTDGAAVAHVGTRTEGTPVAGQHDDAHRGIRLGPVHASVERVRQSSAPCVHALGSIECHHRNPAVAEFEQHRT